ncbi:ROK family protein [Erwinia sp. E_sp_B04_7]|uniref:ROK family protein n=1 Tax=unclassified Erwinia TaxID=2622719 RepID=UPI0030CDFC1E
MTSPRLPLRAGIDMGGTGTRIAVLDGEQEVVSETIPTAWFATVPEALRAQALVDRLHQLLPAGNSLASLGIGASGPVNNQTEMIENNDTLACFSFFPLVAQLREKLAIPVAIDNDAVVAALGEYHLGAGRGSKRMMMVTLGTGIGVALLMDGEPLRSADGRHPEAGHIPIASDPVNCYCGLQGCWEMLASRGWLQQALARQIPDLAWDSHTLGVLSEMSAASPRVAEILYHYGQNVGRGLNTLLTLYGPDITVLSGSAATLLPLYQSGLDAALNRAEGYSLNRLIVQAALGDAAGALGAALLPALRETRHSH